MKVEIKGPIINDSDQFIYDWFRIPATSPSKVNRAIQTAIGNGVKELNVEINSGGGSVFSGAEIWTSLKSFEGTIKVQIVGLAASAASVIAMAGTTIEMSPVAQIMIHNAKTKAEGDYRVMQDTGSLLENVNKSLMSTYILRTALSEEELKTMMDKETWMGAQQAKELGFIDNIMFEKQLDAVAGVEHEMLVNGVLPQAVIDKMRQELAKDPVNNIVNSVEEISTEQGGNLIMNFEQLKNDHPELVKQIQDEAIQNERERIREIENIAQPGTETIVNKAKFETGITAAETAMEILKAQKEENQTKLQNRIEDAKPLNQIEIVEAPANNSNAEVDNLLDKILK